MSSTKTEMTPVLILQSRGGTNTYFVQEGNRPSVTLKVFRHHNNNDMKIGCIVFLVGIVQLGFYQVCHYGNTNYKQQHDQVESGKFKIIKIDSTGKTYIYYARKKDLVYKILTTKDVACKSEKISIGKTYDIELISLLRYEPYKLHINGMKYNGELIKIEPNIIVHDLFESKNINGRCYLSKKIKPDMDVKH